MATDAAVSRSRVVVEGRGGVEEADGLVGGGEPLADQGGQAEEGGRGEGVALAADQRADAARAEGDAGGEAWRIARKPRQATSGGRKRWERSAGGVSASRVPGPRG